MIEHSSSISPAYVDEEYRDVRSIHYWPDREIMDQALMAKGWHTFGRSWLKPDGTEVRYVQDVDVLVGGVEPGDTVHVVGHPAKLLAALEGSGANIIKI